MSIIQTLQTTFWLYLLWVAVISLAIGSFLNVVIYRLPLMMQREETLYCKALLNLPEEKTDSVNLMWPLSRCQSCQHTIRPWHNIPVLSYLLLRGRCAHCRAPISLRYPGVELLTLIISLFIAYWFDVSWQALAAYFFCWIAIPMLFIDIDHQILPDSLTLLLLWVGLFVNTYAIFITPETAIIGAIAGYLVFWLFAVLFKAITGKEGLGGGDFKLLAAIGAWVGWMLLPLVVLIASLIGSVGTLLYMAIKRQDLRGVPIPFGPFLIVGGLLALLAGPFFLNHYLQWVL